MAKTKLEKETHRKDQRFEGACFLISFLEQHVIPVLILNKDGNGRAIVPIFSVAFGWYRTVRLLNDYTYIQAAAASARSVYESVLDVRWMQKFPQDNCVEKYLAFGSIRRRVINDAAFDRASQPGSKLNKSDYLSIRAMEDKQTIDDNIKILFGGNDKPEHWTGFRQIRQRAEKLGDDAYDYHIAFYSQLSGYIHAGPMPLHSVDEVDNTRIIGRIFLMALENMLILTELVCTMLDVKKDIANYSDLTDIWSMYAVLDKMDLQPD
jgi:Family of unknown function (DUF5677)